ncbi:hypothetical protein OBBRIDRAFT_799632 [Obba rivulosa]|uniref:Uncharacterized protein n=1 Tax=Obba rivulosa TaxID=1052685 RepID=A0A8E2DFF8_9APHY|nr:hypothetical protein OBBRIDRAFT_799632 [Obba rivulosa]
MARGDPHLTYGRDVVLDVDPPLRAKLEAVQHYHLRRILGLSARSVTTALFTETGLQPLRYRQLLLALKYLHYLCSLGDTAPYATAAFQESQRLARLGHPSWISDLAWVLDSLRPRVRFDYPLPVCTDTAAHLSADVLLSMETSLAHDVVFWPKLMPHRDRRRVREFRP